MMRSRSRYNMPGFADTRNSNPKSKQLENRAIHVIIYGTPDMANPAKFLSFRPPAITLPPPLPAHEDPWPCFRPLQHVSPLVEPTGAEAYDQEIDAYYRCTEIAAPNYKSMTSMPMKLEETVMTKPPFLDVVVNWLASMARTFGFEPLLPR